MTLRASFLLFLAAEEELEDVLDERDLLRRLLCFCFLDFFLVFFVSFLWSLLLLFDWSLRPLPLERFLTSSTPSSMIADLHDS